MTRVINGFGRGVADRIYPRTIFASATPAGNTLAAETDLHSFTMPAGTLSVIGDKLLIEAFGTFAANANNKGVKLAFNGNTVAELPEVVAFSDHCWFLRAVIVRTTSTQVKCRTELILEDATSGTTVLDGTALPSVAVSTVVAANLDTNTNIVKTTGNATATNDIIEAYLSVDLWPAA